MVLTSVLTYCAACIGLARARTYTQIVALRCLQAAGIAPVIAINNGIMGDVTTKAGGVVRWLRFGYSGHWRCSWGSHWCVTCSKMGLEGHLLVFSDWFRNILYFLHLSSS